MDSWENEPLLGGLGTLQAQEIAQKWPRSSGFMEKSPIPVASASHSMSYCIPIVTWSPVIDILQKWATFDWSKGCYKPVKQSKNKYDDDKKIPQTYPEPYIRPLSDLWAFWDLTVDEFDNECKH